MSFFLFFYLFSFFPELDSFFFSGASPVPVWCLGSGSPPQHPRLHIPSSIISTLSPSHTFSPSFTTSSPGFFFAFFSLSPCLFGKYSCSLFYHWVSRRSIIEGKRGARKPESRASPILICQRCHFQRCWDALFLASPSSGLIFVRIQSFSGFRRLFWILHFCQGGILGID